MIHFDAHADTGNIEFGSLWGHGQPMRRLIESGALRGDRFLQVGLRGYWPPPETLDWMAGKKMRSFEMTEIVHRGLNECLTEAFAIAMDDCDGVFLSVDIDVCDPGPRPGHGAPEPVACRLASCSTRSGGSVSSSRSSVWTWSRWRRRTTTPTSRRHSGNRVVLEALSAIARKRRTNGRRPGTHLHHDCWRTGNRSRATRTTRTADGSHARFLVPCSEGVEASRHGRPLWSGRDHGITCRSRCYDASPSARWKTRRVPTPARANSSERIGLFQLSMFGIGATIGTGIFFILSEAVPIAGPAVILSFLMAGLVAGLTALCYAELAGAVPVSGSSYSYAYATLGELVAIAVGACLLLEYGVSSAAVAVGWSQYVNQLLDNLFGFELPEAISQAPEQGGVINLPAVVLIFLCALLLIRGASESATVNAVMVCIKLGVLAMFIVIAATAWNSDHFENFAPDGFNGVTMAAGVIFFAYIGLDAVSTAGEEVKDPHRNMPLAI